MVDGELVERLEDYGPLRQGAHEMAAHAIADLAEAMLDGPLCAGGKNAFSSSLAPAAMVRTV